jgi:hypothetical protein
MISKIVYLVKSDNPENGYIHPSELSSEDYFGFGGFYIIGQDKELLMDTYDFDAVFRG